MIRTNYDRVRGWMAAVEQPTPDRFTPYEDLADVEKRINLRRSLIAEEMNELFEEIAPGKKRDYNAIVKEACDLLVVTYGLFADLGIDADAAMSIVCDNNDNKVHHRQVRKDGKAIVPKTVKELLKRQVKEKLDTLINLP